jgi:hypothetical protein
MFGIRFLSRVRQSALEQPRKTLMAHGWSPYEFASFNSSNNKQAFVCKDKHRTKNQPELQIPPFQGLHCQRHAVEVASIGRASLFTSREKKDIVVNWNVLALDGKDCCYHSYRRERYSQHPLQYRCVHRTWLGMARPLTTMRDFVHRCAGCTRERVPRLTMTSPMLLPVNPKFKKSTSICYYWI